MKNFTLGSVDLKKIFIHFAIYALGYGAMGGVLFLMKLNFGTYQPIAQLLGGTILDSLKKLLDGQVNN